VYHPLEFEVKTQAQIENPLTLGYPYPSSEITCTRMCGYGFAGVWVRVGLGNPRVTRAVPYLQRDPVPVYQ